MIKFAQHDLPESAIAQVLLTVSHRDSCLTQGILVEKLEQALCEYTGAPFAVAFSSCTEGLHCVLEFLGEGVELADHEDMVVGIPSMTYVSVAEAVLRSGLKLIFQDRVEVGHGYELELHNPRPHSAVRVVDSAHEFGRDTWKKWGSGFVALSFYPTKCLAGAEGGAVLTDNPAFIEYATSWRIGGRTKMGRGYEVKRRGWQANMTDVQAAILVPQLPSHLDMLNTKRADMRDAYNAALGEKNTSLHLYTIDVADRDAFVDYMSEHEVETSIHFPPLHLQVPYRNIKTAQTMSTTNERWATTVSLPLHTRLTEDDVRKVAELVKLWCHSHPISSRALVTSARWT